MTVVAASGLSIVDVAVSISQPAAPNASSAHNLEALLVARQRTPLMIDLGHGDLNNTMRWAGDWPSQMQRMVASAVADRSACARSLNLAVCNQ